MLLSQSKMPDWSANHPDGSAKCLHFPTPTRDYDPWGDEHPEAKDICNGRYDGWVCPRRMECLYEAHANYEASGIWGGMDPEERRLLRLVFPGEPYRWTHEQLERLCRDDS